MVTATEEDLFNGVIDLVDFFGPLIDESMPGGGNDPNGGANGTSTDGSGSSGNQFNEILGTEEDDTINGTAGADLIMGMEGRDSIEGRGGGDRIFGEGDNDTLLGGTGNDSLLGGQQQDFILGGDGSDTLWGGRNNDSLFGEENEDTLYGNRGNDCLFGGLEDDSLLGGKEDDSLDGGEGDDTLVGDRDSDTLTGGAGEDLFAINENTGGLSPSDADIITDYNPEEDDRIGLIDGLARSDIEFDTTVVGGENGVAIRLRDDEEDYLAIVLNVAEGDLDFTII
ncbi:calcium-binding protein [Okeania sp. KiyG1]|uniref:calcium-binding protein n=1 Tax=Okeania sp. KiyG1 TaxID=2720165 RepID=UPI001921205F|nr:calcium-binding protein [Okeania sp. KiyG1]GGA23365.1 hypothetical protein CYANOKiyG1_38580 [Okeania sp. KiyG1]